MKSQIILSKLKRPKIFQNQINLNKRIIKKAFFTMENTELTNNAQTRGERENVICRS